MKLFDRTCFFPQCSYQLIFHHWKCCRMFFCLKYQHKWNAWMLVFCFKGSFSVLFVYALLILIWHLKPAGSWKLADSEWVCFMGVKAQIKKGWMWSEMWNKTTAIYPHWQLMVKSCIVPLPLYTIRLSRISLRTQNRSLTWKRKR